jgi:hypothetical protein
MYHAPDHDVETGKVAGSITSTAEIHDAQLGIKGQLTY